MRVVFLGTPEFAVPSLAQLLDSPFEVAAVFTQPDRPAGRGHKLVSPPVKVLAESRGIPVYQPQRIRAEENRPLIESLRPDFLVVVAFGQILPGWVLSSASIAPVNVHGSLLPAYRGAAPIHWAVMNGETRTGVCTMIMEEALDSGPVLLSSTVEIPSDATTGDLSLVMAEAGARLLIPTLEGLAAGALTPRAQDQALVTWAPRIRKELGAVDWNLEATRIHNRIRALNPWPLCYSELRGQRLQILRSALPTATIDGPETPGCVLGTSEGGLLVRCGSGSAIELLEVQPASRGKMSGRAFAAGARLGSGEVFVTQSVGAAETP